MVKKGVVEGTVKSAAADNEGDPVGTAARCMAAARESIARAVSTVSAVSSARNKSPDPDGKNETEGK